MLKSFIFSTLLLTIIAVYLSYKQMSNEKNRIAILFTWLGSGLFVVMAFLTINLSFSKNPLLLAFPILIWSLVILSVVIEIFSLYKKYIPGQLIAASLLLFLVFPAIFTIGFYLLIIAIVELLIALVMFQKNHGLV